MIRFVKIIMDSSPIYWDPWIYRIFMRLLYGKTYEDRYRIVADMLPSECVVTDLCCGDGFIYTKFLEKKDINYTGVDLFPQMMKILKKKSGCKTITGNILNLDFDKCDYCIMVGSLYHFHPQEDVVLNKMADTGRYGLILESVERPPKFKRKNIILRLLAEKIGYIRNSAYHYRQNSERLDYIISRSDIKVISDELVVNGIYRMVLFEKDR